MTNQDRCDLCNCLPPCECGQYGDSQITTHLWKVVNALDQASKLMQESDCPICKAKAIEAKGAANIAIEWIEKIKEKNNLT